MRKIALLARLRKDIFEWVNDSLKNIKDKVQGRHFVNILI